MTTQRAFLQLSGRSIFITATQHATSYVHSGSELAILFATKAMLLTSMGRIGQQRPTYPHPLLASFSAVRCRGCGSGCDSYYLGWACACRVAHCRPSCGFYEEASASGSASLRCHDAYGAVTVNGMGTHGGYAFWVAGSGCLQKEIFGGGRGRIGGDVWAIVSDVHMQENANGIWICGFHHRACSCSCCRPCGR